MNNFIRRRHKRLYALIEDLDFVRKIVPIVVSVVMFMEFLDSTIINTAIPSIARDFYEDPIFLKFSVTSYFLSLAFFVPISGWVVDRIGTKKLFIFAVTLFTLSSFFCGISSNTTQLSIFRFLQGAGGAFMSPVARIVIIRLFPASELVRVQGIIFAPALLGLVLGPFLGGLITTYLTWHWIFYLNIPVGFVAVVLGAYFIAQEKSARVHPFDFLGFVISGLALGCISFAVDLFGHEQIISSFYVYLSAIVGFFSCLFLVIHCLKKKNPVLDFSLFRIPAFRVGMVSSLPLYIINTAITFLLTLLFQEVFKNNPLQSGFLLLPIACSQFMTRFFAPKVIHYFGFKRCMMISCFFISIALLGFSRLSPSTPHFLLVAIEVVYGGFYIIQMSCCGALNYVETPKNLTSQATSLDLTLRQFLASLGVGLSALLLVVIARLLHVDLMTPQSLPVFQWTLFLFVVFPLMSFVVSFFMHPSVGQVISPRVSK